MRILLSLLILLQGVEEADLVIRGATIVDGTGRDGVAGDLAIKGDTILAVGEWKGTARKTIDAKGLVAAPGFIDLHNHSDASILLEQTRDNYNYTSQGCTTIVTGNCGGGAVDVAALLKQVEENGAGTNVVPLVPHGAVRSKVFGSARRAPTADELEKMKALVEKGMKAGAWGMSTGLIYVPGTYAKTDEIVELAKVVHARGGLYASHIRSEASGLMKALAEAIEIGEKSGCPVQISHLKCSTKEAWGRMAEACAIIEAARARGLRVTADQYPYTASSTNLAAYTVPVWALEGGKLAERLVDPETGPKLRKEILDSFERRDGPDKILVASYSKNKKYNGKTIDAIATESGRDPVDVVIDILRNGGAQVVGFSMREDDMLVGMKKDWVATASDGSAKRPSDERPHPRSYGTFPRKIGVFATERKAISLAAAVRSSSGLPADILGMKDRGYLKAGFKADLVLFDPATFRDLATFDEPDKYSTGARWVTVNGVAVIADGKKTDALPGRPLKRPLQQAPPADARWDRMDYGPFLTTAVTMPWPENAVTPKGIVLKAGTGSVCFDTDLLRYSAGWTGGWLDLLGPPFEGSRKPDLKTRPIPEGTLRFATRNQPGWARGDEFRDPRPELLGPLPADLAKYRGLYVNGGRAVFSYRVGKCEVLDLPGEEKGAITRTLRLGPSPETLTVLLCETPEPRESAGFACGIDLGDLVIGCVRMPDKAEWRIAEKSRVALRIPSHDRPILMKFVFGNNRGQVAAAIQADAVEDPEPLTKGGPARYPEPVATRGVLGKTGAAYEVDTLTVPDANPWNSWMRLGGLDFFADGRAAVCTWSGDVWIVSGIDETLENLSWRRYATGLFQPCGLRIVNDVVYVAARDQITRFHDLNGDGEADFYENFNNDCVEKGNYHEFAMDLQTDRDGNFYYSKGGLGANFPAGPAARHHGCLLKISKDGRTLEIVATGIRAGAGVGVGPSGELTISDNDGHWGPATRLNWVRKGGFYGDPNTVHQPTLPQEPDPPICWIHRSVDNSAGGQVWVTSDAWGPLKGRLLHLSYGAYSLFHVLHERVGNVVQGGVVRFPLTFASGILRGRFHPKDGQLYVAGLKGWSSGASRDGCLQRVRYTGKPVRMVSEMHVKKDAIELTFTDPVDAETAGDPDSYLAQQWNYLYSEKYGSPDFSVANPKKQGRDPVEIASARVSADGRTVTLEIPGLKPVMQMMIRFKIRSADGVPLSQEIWHTIHKVP